MDVRQLGFSVRPIARIERIALATTLWLSGSLLIPEMVRADTGPATGSRHYGWPEDTQ